MVNIQKTFPSQINTQKIDVDAIVKRLKNLKNYSNIPFADKIPFIASLLLDNSYKEKIQRIYLFGSYAYGEPNEESDLDFCIIIDDDISAYRREIAFKIKRKLFDADIIPNDLLVYNANIFYGYTNPQGIENTIIKQGKLLYER